MASIVAEKHDFYVNRHDRTSKNENHHTVEGELTKDNDVNRTQLLYWQKGPNDAQVRVPILCHLAEVSGKGIVDYFIEEHKAQMGCHTFLNPKAIMSSLETYWTPNDKDQEYRATDPSEISCVYPVYQNGKRRRAGQMLLGLKFERIDVKTSGERTFGRQTDNQIGSGGVFDLTDRYLFTSDFINYSNETFNPNIPRSEVLFAIYLCRGARLVVKDDRFYFSQNRQKSENHKAFCGSFFQMGSLLVAEGDLHVEMCFQVEDDNDPTPKYFSTNWMTAADGQNNIFDADLFNRNLEPSERVDKKFRLENTKPLNRQKRFVIFLGANESQHNSICWQLNVETLPGKAEQADKIKVKYSLIAPKGGRIVDIAPWEAGFQQVLWRHKYERLYESVLSPIRTPGLDFQVPPDIMLKRILGIDKTDIEVNVPQVCKVPDYFNEYVYREAWPKDVERMFELTNPLERLDNQMSPPVPPPLYPPIWDKTDSQFYYLQYGSHPFFDRGTQVYKINDQRYRLDKKFADQFVWDYFSALRPDDINWQDLDQTLYRLGNDYRLYKKSETKLGKAEIYYFKKV